MIRIAATFVVVSLLAVPASSNKPAFLASVRPLQALLPVTNQVGEPTGEEAIRNICTTTSINESRNRDNSGIELAMRVTGYWLTAAHCVADLEKRKLDDHLRYVDGHLADVVAVSYEGDMAVLVTHDYSLPAVKLSSVPPTWLDPIVVAGHPLGYKPVFVVPGTVANPYAWLDEGDTSAYLLMALPVAGGNSGSCVFNAKGEVVSIVQVGWGRGFSAVSGGAPYWHVRQFAGKYFGK
jgi:S1-C subfamily serine protease